MITKITATNAHLLIEARARIDGKDLRGELAGEAMSFAMKDDRAAFVFLEKNKAVGYIECKLVESNIPLEDFSLKSQILELGHIARIGVLKEAWRRNVGRKLIEWAEDWFKQAKKRGAWLDFKESNKGAEAFYTATGYTNRFGYTRHEEPDEKKQRRFIAWKTWS
jgi:GNAT superfamily N-acetyltransferase